MGTRDPRIDAYIERSADFARPVLEHLREVVHTACPEVEETMKWSFPHFMYNGILCSMSSFKQHCAFGFWRGEVIGERGGDRAREAMGQFGRITSLADLPPDETLIAYIHQAMKLNEPGANPAARSRPNAKHPKPELAVPDYLTAALEANPTARSTFEGFSPSHRREYVEWLVDAKSEETRSRRLAMALEWLAEGKPRNWKYIRAPAQ